MTESPNDGFQHQNIDAKRAIDGGYVLMSRNIYDGSISEKPPHVREVWMWLIVNASFTERGRLHRGEIHTSSNEIRDALAWKVGYRRGSYSESQIRTAIDILRRDGSITTTQTTRGMLISICN